MLQTFLLISGLAFAASPEPIAVYDLTYALKFDPANTQQVNMAWDHCHAVSTLQGIVNRKGPRLYLQFVENRGQNIDNYWFNQMSAPGEWLAGRKRVKIPNLHFLVQRYRKEINGVVLYDGKVPATSNLASTLAGVHDLIAVRYDPHPQSVFSLLVKQGPKLPVVKRLINQDGSSMFTGKGTIPGTDKASTGSAKNDAYLWLKAHYLDTGKVKATTAAHYIDYYWTTNPGLTRLNHHTLTNHDYFVSQKAWFFDLHVWDDEAPVDDPEQEPGTDLETLKAMLLSAYKHGGKENMIHVGGFTPWMWKYTSSHQAGSKHHPVATEWKLVQTVGAYNGYIDADALEYGAMANASFFTHFPVKEEYPQDWVTRKDLIKRGYLTRDGKVNFKGRDFYLYYVGDFDAAAWVYQLLPSFWNDPNRGKIPLQWAVSPVLEKRAPMVLDYIRRTATKNDYFSAPDNGAGYVPPGMLQEPRGISGLPSGLDAWARHCKPYYERWGLSVTAFIIDGHAPGLNKQAYDCYTRFSPNGIVPQKCPPTMLYENMPVLRASYDFPNSPKEAADIVRERIKVRTVPFHQFRGVLKGPSYYLEVTNRVKRTNPEYELLDAPTFFELLRIWMKNNPKAAAGEIESPR